ncbi:glutamine amidotransferase [Methanobrevibacter sp. OttesenSCG-928-K11]|nr:glutamine amidotransferase [Methanobrevibacter sp. OttesenSCG-928-K11]MDL2270666.1 glutamine amidotransferase [Methanobrevibacter sp. OttesenSCG-928-I08]
MELNIMDMYSDILNVYGDIGNLTCINERCKWRGIEVNNKSFSIGSNEKLDFDNIDMILIGGGSDKGQSVVSEDLLKHRSELENYLNNGGVLLAICGSYQMFGNNYHDIDGENIQCLEMFDIETHAESNRLIGNILVENSIGLTPKTLVGFENHAGRTYHNYNPLGEVKVGHGNNDENKYEGMVYKNFIGTYLHGPFLPKNPHIADYIILNALKNKYEVEKLTSLDDTIEINAHNSMVNKLLNI